jgi:transposase-like protein
LVKKDTPKNIYPPEIKLEAIRLHLEEGIPFKSIMVRLGIAHWDMIKRWVREYRDGRRDFSINPPKTHKTYPPELKLEAARLYEEDGIPIKEIMSKFEIVDQSKLRAWIHKYRKGEREFVNLTGRNSKGRPRKDPDDTVERPKTNQQMEAKLRRLEMENALLKKAWEELRR